MNEPSGELLILSGEPASLPADLLYRILQLRVAVFVVEQQCSYPELDGRDLEPGARWLWASAGEQVLATLRVLPDRPGVARIGRVATAAQARSSGIAGRLMERALAGLDREPDLHAVVLDAQSHLHGWYQRFGFVADGAEFDEDGIAHLPMRRPTGQLGPTGQTGTADQTGTAGQTGTAS